MVMYYIEYILAQIGAIVKDHDLTKAMANDQTMKGYISKGKFDANNNTVTFPKETVIYVKECLEKHAKEHEPYYMAKTYAFDTADFSDLTGRRNVYNTIKNLLNESKSGFIVCSFDYDGSIWFADIDRNFADLSFVKVRSNERFVGIYDNETWKRLDWTVYMVRLSSEDEEIKTAAEFKEKAINTYKGNKWDYALTQEPRVLLPHDTTLWRRSSCTIYSWAPLASKEERRIRVFNEFADFQNYTLNRRSVYYTSKYYNYVPEDITTSIDDLQKTVDDLSKVIDQLLDQISKDTDESEIEELLKQILDELKNNQGGGGGSGGGDVTVDIDLSTTNTLLSKILAKVTQIFDKMSEMVEGAADTAHAKIQETLDEMLVQIKKLKHWTMADTAVNAADAVADWLDFIKGIFDDAENGAGNAVSALSSTMGDAANLMKTKFPFCIPWDVYLIIGFLAEEPQTPVFRLPIKLERLGIEEYIDIDLKDFEIVSSISRTLLTVLYCYGLLNLTMKVFPIAKEGD